MTMLPLVGGRSYPLATLFVLEVGVVACPVLAVKPGEEGVEEESKVTRCAPPEPIGHVRRVRPWQKFATFVAPDKEDETSWHGVWHHVVVLDRSASLIDNIEENAFVAQRYRLLFYGVRSIRTKSCSLGLILPRAVSG